MLTFSYSSYIISKRGDFMKRIVTIQDISCFGKCSITVALPLISAMGTECAILPTSVLSTHTGGFSDFTFRDLSEDMPKISKHWQKCNIKFDTIYTGYLGTKKQIDYVIDFINAFGKEALIFIDPAMADKGQLYSGFDAAFPSHMAKLCSVADITVPNITEACLLTETEYKENYDEKYIKGLAKSVCALGAKNVVITGVSYEKSTQGVYFYSAEKEFSYFSENVPMSFHGTGDIFASVLAGALTDKISIEKSLKIAVDFTVECIKHTLPEVQNHRYGTKFEECIPFLCNLVKEAK